MLQGNFVHLHLHTEYSFLDGAIKIDDLVEVASRYQFPALAITDHGNMCGAIEFYKKVSQAGIKPIIGEEVYLAPKSRFDREQKATYYHLVLLAKNEKGYKNLIKLSSLAHKEGFYYKPRIDKELLRIYSEGLIALSGCIKGEIAHNVLHGSSDNAKKALLEYIDIFGKDNFYLEIMRLGLKENEVVNGAFFALSEEIGVRCVATNDCHYIRKEDSEIQDILLCLQTGKDFNDPKRMRFDSNELYFRSPEEMAHLFIDHEEIVRNTIEIAERCNLDLSLDRIRPQLPRYEVPSGFASCNQYLKKLAQDGLKEKYSELNEEIKTRFEHEMDIISKMGLSGYFLIISDIVEFARKKNIPVGPGRGSCVGSLVLYSLGITDIDPLRYGLIFERFLNPERAAMPDVDLDFSDRRRDEIILFIKKRYGEPHVSQIITFGRMAARAAIRDVGRVLKVPLIEVDRIAKAIPPKLNLKEAYEDENFKKIIDEQKEYKKLLSIAMKLEGIARHASVHAAGIVVAPGEITDFTPLYRMPDGSIVTQYPMEGVEALGLLKIDILGLKVLTIIIDTLNILKDRGEELNLKNIPLSDKKTYNLLSKGATKGVFQLESDGMKDILKKIEPDSFTDIMAILALYRPGPLGGLTKDSFIRRKHKRERPSYAHKSLKPILEETYGVMLYQEQVMKIAVEVAGFSPAEADILRRAMGKKIPEIMDEKRKAFVDGAVKRRYREDTAEKLFDLMVPFAGYGFNKSHSAAYALLSYQTAYLKAHYPREFLASVLSNESSSSEKVAEFIKETSNLKISVYPPDINKSLYQFFPEGEGIRFGLCAVKNVGEKAALSIISIRKTGMFKSFLGFLNRIDQRIVTKRALESLIKAGLFDEINNDRNGLLENLGLFLKKRGTPGQVSLFKVDIKREPLSLVDRLSYEKESLGFYLSGHPLNRYSDELSTFVTASSSSLSALPLHSEQVLSGIVIKKKTRRTQKGDEPFTVITLEDLEGIYEGTAYDMPIPDKETPVLVKGKVGTFSGNRNMRIDKIVPLSKVREQLVKAIEIEINLIGIAEETLKKLKSILLDSKGDKEVFLRLVEDKKCTIARSTGLKVSPKRATLSKIRKLLGESSVVLKGGI